VSGLVRFRPEQISAVTDLVPEQRQPDHMITSGDAILSYTWLHISSVNCQHL